ncbi:MAG TPA: hypothetical protein VMK12_09225 [Anaeromyxobacteraceae bacterium]|nr:hypothetical protein [Anaeromyxobacteraceae bacterium]
MLAVHAGRGGASAKEKLVRHNLVLVLNIVRKRRGTVELADLVRERRAVQKFDPHAGTHFSPNAA